MELVVTEVERGVDGLEGLEIDVDLAFLSLGSQDFTTVDDQAIRRNLVVQLETLLGRGDGGQDRLPVDTGLDIGRRALFWYCQRAGPYLRRVACEWYVRILQPTSLQHEKPDPWGLVGGQSAVLIPTRLDKGRHVRMMREIMDVPLPRAASSLLMSFLTFHISI